MIVFFLAGRQQRPSKFYRRYSLSPNQAAETKKKETKVLSEFDVLLLLAIICFALTMSSATPPFYVFFYVAFGCFVKHSSSERPSIRNYATQSASDKIVEFERVYRVHFPK